MMAAPAEAWKASTNVRDHFNITPHGNNSTWDCKWCPAQFNGSATRAYAHLTGRQAGSSRKGSAQCPAVPEDVRERLIAAKTQANAEKENKKRHADVSVDQLERSQAFGRVTVSVSSGVASSAPVIQMLRQADVPLVHKKFAAFVYEEGLPLNVCKSLALREFIEVLQQLPRGVKYTPPAYQTMRTTLRTGAKGDVEKQLQWWSERTQQTGCSVSSDGWSDPQNRPLLNVMCVNTVGAKFITAINTEGQTKTGVYISEQLMVVLEEIGPENVVQVVTDSAANCKAAGQLLMAAYPHITWSPCVAHVCDLALEDIFKLDYFKGTFAETKEYITFIKNHHATMAAWRLMSPEDLTVELSSDELAEFNAIKELQLLKPGDTRFASELIMLERIQRVRTKLEQFVVCDRFRDAVATMKAADQIKGQLEALSLPVARRQEVVAIWESRWHMMDSPLHGAAYCLDPEFMNDDGLSINNDGDACFQNLLTIMKRLIPDKAQRAAARASYTAFRAKEGLFGTEEAQEDAACTPPHQWWDFYGKGHPELQGMAVRVLSQVTSACFCERAWSAYDFIHTPGRNKLTPSRACDLVYVFSNKRLVRKMERAEGEAFIPWDEEEEQEEL